MTEVEDADIADAGPGATDEADVELPEPGEEWDEGWGEAPPLARWRPLAALALSLAGFGVSLYLTVEHYTGNSALSCPATATFNCLKVTTSPQSMIAGVPVALLGLLFYAAMVAINVPILWRRHLRWVAWARLAMAVGGMGFVVYLIYTELFSIKAVCLWCTAVHAITFLLFVLVLSSLSGMLGPRWEEADLTP